MTKCAWIAMALLWSMHAHGASNEERVRDLERSFRCLVCQNETLADSTADLAADLRAKVAEQVEAGATDQEVRDFMVQRYGDFVLYTPPWRPRTWLLWLGPFALLAAGGWALARIVARRRSMTIRALAPGDQRRAEALLARKPEDARP